MGRSGRPSTLGAGKFSCTADFSKIAECDAVPLAIQTPFLDKKDLFPDFTPLVEGLWNAGRYLMPGTLVVLGSTITAGMAGEILEAESGLVAGEDFPLVHAPERWPAGCSGISGSTTGSSSGSMRSAQRRAVELSSPVLVAGTVILMNCATVSEVTKIAENAFRDLQIAVVNQLALPFEAMGINVSGPAWRRSRARGSPGPSSDRGPAPAATA